jgi:DNA topoisomerase I
MENSLDSIADGDLDSIEYLNKIYFGKTGLKALVGEQDKAIVPEEAREIRLLGLDNFVFKVGKFGAYVCTQREGAEVSASVPDQDSPADITAEIANRWIDQKINGADALGKDPVHGLPVYALNGRFGPYVQLGDVGDEKIKPKRVSLPAGLTLEQVDLAKALKLLEFPKFLGEHPVLKKPVQAGLGRFGPFVVCEKDFRSIPKTMDLLTVDFTQAMELLNQPKKGRGRAAPLREMGEHPGDKTQVQIYNGPYGPYIKWGKVNASLPEGVSVEQLTMVKALELLADKAQQPKRKRR